MSEKTKIVMVDDEIELCTMVKENLEETNQFEIIVTDTPEQAVPLIQQEAPDIIIVDVVMPKLSGPELICQIREQADIANIPIIVASGLGEMVYSKKKDSWKWMPNSDVVLHRGEVFKEKDPERASEAYGVDNFVAKPYTTDTMVEVINETIAIVKKSQPEHDKDSMSE